MAASQKTLVAHINPTVRAGTDLRAHQFKAVSVFPTGVRLADTNSCDNTRIFILGNAPGSGEAAELITGPSVTRVTVATVVPMGAAIGIFGATGLLTAVTSMGDPRCVGIAWDIPAAGSGELIGAQLIK